MSFIVNTVVIFAVATAAVLLTPSSAVPTAADLHIPSCFDPSEEIQQDYVPDLGFGDWFTGIFDNLTKVIAKKQDPEKIEEVRKSIKKMRTLVTPVANFIQQYYPNDCDASNAFIMKAINSFYTLPVNLSMITMSQKDVDSLAMLIKMLKTVTS